MIGPFRNFIKLERAKFYMLARLDEVLDAVGQVVRAIATEFGPGRAWTLAGRVGLNSDDGLVQWATVDGAPHVLLRCYVCHENGPRAS